MTEFLTHLARHGNVPASTQNQALSALLFLYKDVLKREIGWPEADVVAPLLSGFSDVISGPNWATPRRFND